MLRVHTFGGCFIERDGTRVDALSGQRKALALFAALAVGSARGVSRETLLAFLWPESDEERARTSLRQLVHALRTQLAAPELLLPSAELQLNPGIVESDVDAFHDALRREDDEAALALYVGPFLDGFYLRGADAFERWVATERASIARSAAMALERLAERAGRRGDARAAVEWWRRLTNAEPLSARATTGLMRALDAAGERAAALQHARVYETLVREEVGGAPDPSVRELSAQLRRVQASSPPAETAARRDGTVVPEVQTTHHAEAIAARPRPAGDAAALPSIAVLPFANVSGDPADEHLSDGLTDELIGVLGKVPGLKVTGRTSAFALKGRDLDVRTIADALGVATLLEGSWRRVGTRLKVSAQLVGAPDGAVLWAEAYDRELADVLVVQEEIARAIVAALRPPLGSVREHPAPTDPATYELYLKGRFIFRTQTGRDGVLQAVGYFEQAVARDPAYAAAYSGLSDAYTRLAIFGYGAPQENFVKAKAAAFQALALDSSLVEAHVSLAHVLLIADFAWAAAEPALRRAIALDPSYTFARAPLAICLASQGRFDEAIAQLNVARALDPLSPSVNNLLGRVYVGAGRPDEAIGILRQALELDPRLDLAHQQLGHAYLQKGMASEAIAAFRHAAALSGPRDTAQLAYAYAVAGQRDEAERTLHALLDSLEPLAPRGPGGALHYHVAMAFAGLNDVDAAFAWLERGYVERASFMGWAKAEPGFTHLRSDPRWPALLRRMGLAP